MIDFEIYTYDNVIKPHEENNSGTVYVEPQYESAVNKELARQNKSYRVSQIEPERGDSIIDAYSPREYNIVPV